MLKWLGQRSDAEKPNARQLWNRQFNVVKNGLDEKEVVAFVNDLIAEYEAAKRASSESLRSILKTAITDAEQIAASVKMKAQGEAEAEAARIVAQARQEAEEIKRRVELAAQKETEDILSAANRTAEITEVEAKQQALLLLLNAREEVEKELRDDYKRAYSRLFSSLQQIMDEGHNIETEMRNKRAELWQGKEFRVKEYEAAQLGTPGVAAPDVETSAPVEAKVEVALADKGAVEAPAQPEKEAGRKAEGAKKAKEADKPAKKEAEIAAKEEAKRKVKEAKKAKEAEKQAKKETKLAAKRGAKGKEKKPLQREVAKEKKEATVPVPEEVPQAEAEKALTIQEEAVSEEVEAPVQVREVMEQKTEEPVLIKEKATVPEAAETDKVELGELPLEIAEEKEAEPTRVVLDGGELYTGEVEMVIDTPVALKLVTRLYNYLQTIPDLRILYTRGSWDRGTTITVVLDKGLPLINLMSETPGVKVIPELLEKEGQPTIKSGLPLRGGERKVKRLRLVLKEPRPH